MITGPQRIQIAARSLCDLRTIERAYRGRTMRPVTLARITQAARELGLPLPPGAPAEAPLAPPQRAA